MCCCIQLSSSPPRYWQATVSLFFYFLRNLSSRETEPTPGNQILGLLKSCCTCCFPPSLILPPSLLCVFMTSFSPPPPNCQTESSSQSLKVLKLFFNYVIQILAQWPVPIRQITEFDYNLTCWECFLKVRHKKRRLFCIVLPLLLL